MSLQVQPRPTQRAADGWESAAFSSIFLASGFFYISSLFPARPPAANANRWLAVELLTEKQSMENKNYPIIKLLSVLLIPLLGALLGAFLGISIVYYYTSVLWKHYEISPFQGAKSILHVDAHFSPTDDVLYIVSENGTVFYNTLFQNEWQVAPPIPKQEYNLPSCPPEWDIPIKNNVIDSVGINISDIDTTSVSRCYALFNDGSIEVWTRTQSTFYAILAYAGGGLGLIIGSIIGVIISASLWHKIGQVL
jgi:hypothetical protein